jgi:hypothetical protein
MAKQVDYRKGFNVPGKRGPKTGSTYLSTSDPTRRTLWLKTFRESGGSYNAACEASAPHLSGNSKNAPGYSSWKALEARDPAWAAQVEEVRQQISDDIEAELHRRSVTGVPTRVYQKATMVWQPVLDADNNPVLDVDGKPKMEPATITRWSDAILLRRASALMPEKYADKKTIDINHNVNRGGAWTITAMDIEALSANEQVTLAAMMAKVRSHRKGVAQIEHQPAEVIEAEFESVEDDAPAEWELAYQDSNNDR